MNQDFDGLEWLRDLRKQIAAEYHYDPKEMGDSYRSLQQEYQSRLLTPDQMALTVGLKEAPGFGKFCDGGTK
jgi:hypothetical protein